MNGFKHTKGPLTVKIDDKWPFKIRTIDADGNIVFSRELPCYSTSDKCADDAINCINFHADKRAEYSAINKQAIADETLRAAAPEMLDILISFCDGNCGVIGYCEESKCHDTCALREAKEIIERATGLTINDAIKAWEADRK